MKKLIVSLIILVAATTFLYAQETPAIELTEAEMAQILAKRAAESTPSAQTSKIMGWGKEVGEVFASASSSFITTLDEGAEVTIERIDEFSNTKVGMFTMVVVGWKILGNDLYNIGRDFVMGAIGIFVVLPLLCVLLNRFYKTYFGRSKVLDEHNLETKVKKYKYLDPIAEEFCGDQYGGTIIIWLFVIGSVFALFCLMVF